MLMTAINNKDEYTSHASLTKEKNIFFDLTFTKLIRGRRGRVSFLLEPTTLKLIH